MNTVQVLPATPERWADLQHALSGGGDGANCQCRWWFQSNTQWRAGSADERKSQFHQEVRLGPAPGLIGYVDGVPAGWVRVGPRVALPRIRRSRTVRTESAYPIEQDDVWAVSCFEVRREYRRHGLTAELLAAAIDFARAGGARVIESYPIDASAGNHRSNDLYYGVASVFERAGFIEHHRTTSGKLLMSLILDQDALTRHA